MSTSTVYRNIASVGSASKRPGSYLAGRPLREPVVSYGPFVMNSERQIASTIERYRAGAMGALAPAN